LSRVELKDLWATAGISAGNWINCSTLHVTLIYMWVTEINWDHKIETVPSKDARPVSAEIWWSF